MDFPKPHPYKSTSVVVEEPTIVEQPKHIFVLKPHLTQPLRNNEVLMNLKKSMVESTHRNK